MVRNIIEINQQLCIGCGLCSSACHQGAIQVIDGKASLISSTYCDGLGKCLPQCPVDAISVVEKDTDEFDENRRDYAVHVNDTTLNSKSQHSGCKSAAPRILQPNLKPQTPNNEQPSMLKQWPVQLMLISPEAAFLEHADLLICADCVPFAYPNLHQEFMRDKIVIVGCPKLDNTAIYSEKLTAIFAKKNIKSIMVLRMEVPCCGGMTRIVEKALIESGKNISYSERIISIEGKIKH